ncbi:MAG: serine protein kinase PrkA, partial [Proteobacteria bacterium]
MTKHPIESLERSIHNEFEATRQLLTFEEYLEVLRQSPDSQLRSSAKYAADMMDHFGKDGERFRVFDDTVSSRKVVGQEAVQNQIYNALRTFERQGFNNKLILLHGPNGSAKSSILSAMLQGLESYSRTSEGALYTFNWVFPIEQITKGTLGLGGTAHSKGRTGAYAKLPDSDVAARLPSELKDHPLLLVPIDKRLDFLIDVLGESQGKAVWERLPQVYKQGDLNHRCKEVQQALLKNYGGDFRRVLDHVQVERLFFSKRYRKGLVTIEPQLHVDAQYGLLSMNRSLSQLPPSLSSLNLFTVAGDLIDGNRGAIEYNDLLKRPMDSFKYLLVACESGSVNVGQTIVFLDTLFMGSCNELQLDAFKEFPDFTSFKARIELIKVPYLLSVTAEKQIYREELKQVQYSKFVAPHTDWTIAAWAVLTRLRKPNSMNFAPGLSSIVASLSPLDKAKLLDTGEAPGGLSSEDRKLLKANAKRIRDEYLNTPYYEGRTGASAREMKSVLFSAAQNPDFPTLSPLAVLRELEEFVKRTSEYEFLKQDVRDGYHDAVEFISVIRNDYLNTVDREVRDSIGLYDQHQWEDFIRKYVMHISLVLKKERFKNPRTGAIEDPDYALISEFEKIIEAPQSESELTA